MNSSSALDVAIAYYRAWSDGDFETAMSFISPEIDCHAPIGPIVGAEAFRAFMGPFVDTMQGTRLLAAYGDDHHALLMYDAATPLVADAPGAEWHTVEKGRITRMMIIFDQLPFDQARRLQAG